MTVHRTTVFQSEHHPLVNDVPKNVEELALSLIHRKAYVDSAELVDGATVLDVGCNTGYGSRILAERAKKVTGIDVSESALEYAKQHYSAENLDFQLADGAQIDFPNDSFDIVTSFQVIEHVQDTVRYLSEILRVLKPLGKAVFTTPNSLLRIDPNTKPWNIFHVREYSPDELKEELQPFFSEVEIRGLNAESSLHETLVSKFERARRVAKSRTLYSIKAFLLERANSPVQKSAERIARLIIPSRRKGASISFSKAKESWDLESLWYRTTELNSALDLMAICSAPLVKDTYHS